MDGQRARVGEGIRFQRIGKEAGSWGRKFKEKQESSASLEPWGRGLKGCMCPIPSGMSERASPTANLPA